MRTLEPLICAGCHRPPAEIPGIVEAAVEEAMTPDAYVRSEEGTLDRESGLFLCDGCYIAHGMPTAPGRWTATPANVAALGLDVP